MPLSGWKEQHDGCSTIPISECGICIVESVCLVAPGNGTNAAMLLQTNTAHLELCTASRHLCTLILLLLAAFSFCLHMQRAHWQAHDGSIASVDIIPARSSSQASSSGNDAADASTSTPRSSSSQVLILTSSRDCNVAVWTLDGGLVGMLGEHSWDLDDQGTWQDPKGLAKRAPKQPIARDDDDGGEVRWFADPPTVLGLHALLRASILVALAFSISQHNGVDHRLVVSGWHGWACCGLVVATFKVLACHWSPLACDDQPPDMLLSNSCSYWGRPHPTAAGFSASGVWQRPSAPGARSLWEPCKAAYPAVPKAEQGGRVCPLLLAAAAALHKAAAAAAAYLRTGAAHPSSRQQVLAGSPSSKWCQR